MGFIASKCIITINSSRRDNVIYSKAAQRIGLRHQRTLVFSGLKTERQPRYQAAVVITNTAGTIFRMILVGTLARPI